jgi:chemotaxis protein MotB
VVPTHPHRRIPTRESSGSRGSPRALELRRADDLLRELEEGEASAVDPGWSIGFTDVLLLLVTLFAVLLAITYLRGGRDGTAATDELALALDFPLPEAPVRLEPQALLGALRFAPPPAPRVVPVLRSLHATAGVSVEAEPASLRVAGTPGPMRRLAARIAGIGDPRLEVLVDDTRVRLEVRDEILFPLGSAELAPGGRALLDGLAGKLGRDGVRVAVEGHTDDLPIATARFPSNWELSSYRATTVARYLVSRGVAPERLEATGFADTQPRVPNDSPAHRALNRRVSIVLAVSPGAGDGARTQSEGALRRL